MSISEFHCRFTVISAPDFDPFARSKNGWWGEPVQFFVQHINNCQSFDGSPIQNGSICALPSRIGRTQLRAVQKLSEGPYVETETYPKEMEMSPAVPFLRHLV